MPYIKEEDRDRIDSNKSSPSTEGELNYYITMAVNKWLEHNGVNYSTLNAAIGVLECAKLELYRRIVSPYEDKKIKENGDVYSSEG